jgi:hypothetical protein
MNATQLVNMTIKGKPVRAGARMQPPVLTKRQGGHTRVETIVCIKWGHLCRVVLQVIVLGFSNAQ